MKYYPCIFSNTAARINHKVAGAMSLEAAEDYLKKYHLFAWLRCDAIPQLVRTK